jgi:mannose-6-phosphate isomerase-like protein (cupin superfamily)
MSDYTIRKLADVPDAFGDSYPGEMRFAGPELGTEQVAVTHRRMPPHTGGKGGYGHRHKTQEEVYLLLSGRLQLKLDDEVLELEGPTAVRVAPQVVRSVWNEGPGDAQLLIVSTRLEPGQEDHELIEGFWPA